MSKNSLLYVLIVVAVVLAAALALTPGKAASPADRSYDQIELMRSSSQADRSYDQIETERGSQIGPAGLDSSDNIDFATRSYMAWAKAVEEQQKLATAKIDRSFHTPQTSNYRSGQGSIQCLDNECLYELPDGRWVK